jgi:hypothetical protein
MVAISAPRGGVVFDRSDEGVTRATGRVETHSIRAFQ